MSRRALLLLPFTVAIGVVFACGDDDEPNNTTPTSDGGTDSSTSNDAGGDATNGSSSGGTLWKSGTRLRAEVDTAGEAKRFYNFFDTVRNEVCSMSPVSGGAFACVPAGPQVLYDDAECKTPIALSFGSCSDFLYAARYESTAVGAGGCEPGAASYLARLYTRGAAIPPRDGFSYHADGSCSPVAMNGQKYFAVGAEVPLTDFVSATLTREDLSAELSRGRIIGADGSELAFHTFVDRARDAGCNSLLSGTAAAPASVCASTQVAYTDQGNGPFADTSCTTPIGTTFDRKSCPPPDVIQVSHPVDSGLPEACGPKFDFTLHSVGAGAAIAYTGKPGSCVERFGSGNSQYFAVGAAIDPTGLPKMDETFFGNGRGRIHARSNAGIRLEHGGFYDDTVKSPCYVAEFSDGKIYCVPDTVPYIGSAAPNRYKDAECKQPLGVGSDCSSTPTFFIQGATTEACGAYSPMGYPVGAKIVVTETWSKSGADCIGPVVVSEHDTFYEVGALTPVSTVLLEVQRVRE